MEITLKTKVGVAADHAGFEYKEKIKKYLINQGYNVVDYGTHSSESASYAEFGKALGQALHDGKVEIGFGFCGTGLGISYAMNRFKKVRAARVATVEDAHLARQHNDANALAIGQRTNTYENALAMVQEFLKTDYEGGRHQSRIDELDIDAVECWMNRSFKG
ncbi:ribose 5-phosphate isomerase B [Candidatus Mycoplasma pogonae]